MKNFSASFLVLGLTLGACAHKATKALAPTPTETEFKWIGPVGDRISIQQEEHPEMILEFKVAGRPEAGPRFQVLINGKTFWELETNFGRTPRREAFISTSNYGPSFLILSEYMGDGCPVVYRGLRIEAGQAHDLGQFGNCEDIKELKVFNDAKGRPHLHISFGPREYLGRTTPAKTWKF